MTTSSLNTYRSLVDLVFTYLRFLQKFEQTYFLIPYFWKTKNAIFVVKNSITGI